MKIFPSLFIVFFSLIAYSHTAEDLAMFWAKLRFQDCDPDYVMQIVLRNPYSLGTISKESCLSVDLVQTSNKDTIECFKKLDKTLQISLDKVIDLNPEKFSCKKNPGYNSFIQGDSSSLKPAEKISTANIICREDEKGKKFAFATVDGKSVCTKKYNCNRKFTFGSAVLEDGTYYLRCHLKPTSQSDCDPLNLAVCEGQEVGYVKLNYGGLTKSSPVFVTPSVKTGN